MENKNKLQFRKEVGFNIKRIRKEQGLTQMDLTGLTGLDRSYISEIETGKSSITLDTLLKIKKALKVELERLFDEEKLAYTPFSNK